MTAPINSSKTPAPSSTEKTDVRGVFSSQEIRKVGTGTTTRKTVQKSFWYVEQKGDEIYCQPLNSNYVPSGPQRKITMDELINKFSPEPEFYFNSVFPKMMELQNNIASGDDHREKGENFTAEYEYSRALKIDVDNVRANFGIGITYLERGDKTKAQDIFERLLNIEGTFDAEHTNLFNNFGISLRKNKMLQQALEYYQRALELTKNDENLYMNIARVQLELKNLPECTDNLLQALKIAPRHALSLKFLAWLIQHAMIPADKMDDVRAALQAATQNNSAALTTESA